MTKQKRKKSVKPAANGPSRNLQIMDAEVLLTWETKLGAIAVDRILDSNGACLQIFDADSGECVIQVDLTAQQLGRLIASHGRVAVKADWQPVVRPAIRADPVATMAAAESEWQRKLDEAMNEDARHSDTLSTGPETAVPVAVSVDEPGVEPRKPGKAYLEVVHCDTKKVVERLDMTGRSERHVDRVERGLLINMSENYMVDRFGC